LKRLQSGCFYRSGNFGPFLKQLEVSGFFVTCDHFWSFQTVNFRSETTRVVSDRKFTAGNSETKFRNFLKFPDQVSGHPGNWFLKLENSRRFRNQFQYKNMKLETRRKIRNKFQKKSVIVNRKLTNELETGF
jgi:hypothetical protein